MIVEASPLEYFGGQCMDNKKRKGQLHIFTWWRPSGKDEETKVPKHVQVYQAAKRWMKRKMALALDFADHTHEPFGEDGKLKKKKKGKKEGTELQGAFWRGVVGLCMAGLWCSGKGSKGKGFQVVRCQEDSNCIYDALRIKYMLQGEGQLWCYSTSLCLWWTLAIIFLL